jgi:mono/diheme cytochrome c family protein
LSDIDVEKIASYFADKYPPGTPTDDSKRLELSYDPSASIAPGVMKAGHPKRGGKLFKTHCANCHGADGSGKVGPVLKGRALTNATFWAAVINGKRNMPAFKDLLVPAQIVDIRAWLEQIIEQPAKKPGH